MKIANPKFNASKELVSFDGMMMDGNKAVLSDAKTLELVNQVKALPRISVYTGSAAPRVVIDGKEYALAFKFFTDSEKETYKSYRSDHVGSGTGPSSGAKLTEAIVKELLTPEIFSKLSKETQEFLNREKEKFVDPQIKALMKLGFTEEQAKAALALKK